MRQSPTQTRRRQPSQKRARERAPEVLGPGSGGRPRHTAATAARAQPQGHGTECALHLRSGRRRTGCLGAGIPTTGDADLPCLPVRDACVGETGSELFQGERPRAGLPRRTSRAQATPHGVARSRTESHGVARSRTEPHGAAVPRPAWAFLADGSLPEACAPCGVGVAVPSPPATSACPVAPAAPGQRSSACAPRVAPARECAVTGHAGTQTDPRTESGRWPALRASPSRCRRSET